MRPDISVSSTDATAKLKASLGRLARKQVYVGIPEDHTGRNEKDITNAGLMYIHTHGSPLHHIPPRPVIEPALAAPDNKQLITNQLGEAARAALSAKTQETQQHLNQAGMLGRNAAIRWFTDPRNGWPANAESTIHRKGSSRPLIDTAQLRRSLTYVITDE
jgi:hypothetical protein